MRAVVATGQPGVEAIAVREVPEPGPRGAEVRVRVRAAGINRADLMQARGHYPAPPGAPEDLLGLEYAGEVESIGPGCLGLHKVGDRVFGIVGGGGMAEFVVTHERLAVPIPTNLEFEQAAAVPEVFLTAHDAIETQGRARPGERVLIHAVGGGVGSAAAQVASAMGCTVFGTSRTAEKLERMAEYGVDHGILTSRDDWPEEVNRLTGDAGVDVLIDHLGGPSWEANVEALGMRGRLVVVGLLAGSKAQVDLRTLMRKRLTVVGTTLRARPIEEKIAATRRFASSVVPWLERGRVRPIVDRVFPLDQVGEAQKRMESNASFGKIVLVL
jgi:NADPH2:quinone reductase